MVHLGWLFCARAHEAAVLFWCIYCDSVRREREWDAFEPVCSSASAAALISKLYILSEGNLKPFGLGTGKIWSFLPGKYDYVSRCSAPLRYFNCISGKIGYVFFTLSCNIRTIYTHTLRDYVSENEIHTTSLRVLCKPLNWFLMAAGWVRWVRSHTHTLTVLYMTERSTNGVHRSRWGGNELDSDDVNVITRRL